MARKSCFALRPIGSYQVTREEGGYKVSEPESLGQADPIRNKVVTWLSQLSEQDYEQGGRCLARADGVLLDIRRRPAQAGDYIFDITVYSKLPKLGWVWLSCLGLAILALAVSALGLWLTLQKEPPTPLPDGPKPDGTKDNWTILRKGYQEVQETFAKLRGTLSKTAEEALKEKADDGAEVTIVLEYRKQGKRIQSPDNERMKRSAEDWKKLCEFLAKCAEVLANDSRKPAEQGGGQ